MTDYRALINLARDTDADVELEDLVEQLADALDELTERERPVSGDPFDSPEWRDWSARVLDELVPKLRDSSATISIVPRGESDVKFAVELGMSIMLGKPIILAIAPGQQVPASLARVADEIVELHWGSSHTDDDHIRLQEAIGRVIGYEGNANG